MSESFSDALSSMKDSPDVKRWRRDKWKKDRRIFLKGENIRLRSHVMSHFVMEFFDGGSVPWSPTRCDLIENDWKETNHWTDV